ncbi:uncharacterized protein LOC132743830 [Ruditapes philippinarum]|uniref:uncharacterized protein LOC132743830 n=1 Tax=Ruditapes philippinarum TaxID=129788 RepID=UPI00295AC240|nr:uncharacterized protein LOC132743830 [Ruditapes philippinarum]
MIHQKRATERDCDSLQCLLLSNRDMMRIPDMQVYLLGATSYPSCSAYALKRTAQHHAQLFEQKFVTTVKRNFYVDDCLKSVDNEQNVIDLVRDLQSIMNKGGFRLTKWITNSRTVLSIISDLNIRTSGNRRVIYYYRPFEVQRTGIEY